MTDRLKQPDAQMAEAGPKKRSSGFMLGIALRSTCGSEGMWRRAAWSPFNACQIAFSTTLLCLDVSEAMYSRQIPAASQNSANSRPVNSPPSFMRKHHGGPMPFMSARKRLTCLVVSDFSRILYARCHREALSTNMIM